MSNAYYQGYGTQTPTNYNNNGDSGTSQHLNYHHQNLQNPGYAAGDEYMRQPASAPYPSAPVVEMPQPTAHIIHQPSSQQYLHHHVHQPLQQPPIQHQQLQQEPRVIIVHRDSEPDCCCECFRYCCGCLNGIVSGLCQIILAIVFIIGIIVIAVYFAKFYKQH